MAIEPMTLGLLASCYCLSYKNAKGNLLAANQTLVNFWRAARLATIPPTQYQRLFSSLRSPFHISIVKSSARSQRAMLKFSVS